MTSTPLTHSNRSLNNNMATRSNSSNSHRIKGRRSYSMTPMRKMKMIMGIMITITMVVMRAFKTMIVITIMMLIIITIVI